MSNSSKEDGIPFTDELRRNVDRMTTFQRKYCEYRGRGLNQPDSAEKAGSQAQGRQALGRVGYNIEATVQGAKEYISYLMAVKAKAACVSELEIIEGLRDVVRNSSADGKYGDAVKALELLGTYINMFGKGKGQAVDQQQSNKQSTGPKNNVNAFKDEGETEQERAKKLGKLVALMEVKE